MFRHVLALGMFAALAFSTAVRSLGFAFGSPPPSLAAIVSSRISLVNSFPLFASTTAFLCFIPAHLECPDM